MSTNAMSGVSVFPFPKLHLTKKQQNALPGL